jgi:hypothetical protein
MTRPSWAVATAVAAAMFLAPPAGRAAPAPGFQPAFIPADAAGFYTLHVADLWDHSAVKAVRDKMGSDASELFKQRGFNLRLGAGLDQIEYFTLIEGTPRGPEEEVGIVSTARPYDRKAILAAFGPDAEEKKAGDRTYYDTHAGMSVSFLDDRNYALAPREEALAAYLKRGAPAREGPLAPVLKLAAGNHLMVAGVDVAAVAGAAPKNSPPPELFKPLLKARLATLTVDLDGELRADARLTFDQEADAKEGVAGVDALLDEVRGGFAQMLKQLPKELNTPKLAAILDGAEAALKAAKAEQKGTTVQVAASLKIDAEAITAAAEEAAPKVREAAKRARISGGLKQLGLAMHSYNDALNWLPAQANYDKNGKPLLSWRVHLLPYIEQADLYQQFHLDEPWDSEQNKKLLEKMPAVFAPPDSPEFKNHETHFQAVVGKGTIFEVLANPPPGPISHGLSLPRDIPDGTSFTILFVEAKQAVPWTKPEDVSYEKGKMLSKLGGVMEGKFTVALCDGSVHFFPLSMKEELLDLWLMRNSGEVKEQPDK